MNFKGVLLSLFCLLGGSQILFGQSSVSNQDATFSRDQFSKEFQSGDWSFYVDEDNKTYYIDFENISVNLSEVVVKNDKGEVVLKESVIDLPVNTIYELDMSRYASGNYQIELKSFTTSVIRKEVSVR